MLLRREKKNEYKMNVKYYRDLLLNDPEIRELIREIASDKKSKTP